MAPDDVPEIMTALAPLLGAWSGTGEGQFPTIRPFRYREELRFELDGERPLIHYEQRTSHCELGTTSWVASHWESGFLRPVGAHLVEMTNAQDGGRLEILRLSVERSSDGVRLAGESTAVINDDRVAHTRRTLEVVGDVLTYEVRMGTTRVPAGALHLQAKLSRVAGGVR